MRRISPACPSKIALKAACQLVTGLPLVIVKEVHIVVQFALMTRSGTLLEEIRTVGSHPHAIAQARQWLAANLRAASTVMTSSTAEAAAQVAYGELDAAISAPIAASANELAILANDIADTPAAVTRFVLIRRPCAPPAPTGADRTLLAVTSTNQPGSLVALLTELSIRGIDLTRLESRPNKSARNSPWFYLDCAGHVADPAIGEAMAALKRRCDQVRYLGSYPCGSSPDESTPPAGGGRQAGAHDITRAVDPSGDRSFRASLDWLRQIRAGA